MSLLQWSSLLFTQLLPIRATPKILWSSKNIPIKKPPKAHAFCHSSWSFDFDLIKKIPSQHHTRWPSTSNPPYLYPWSFLLVLKIKWCSSCSRPNSLCKSCPFLLSSPPSGFCSLCYHSFFICNFFSSLSLMCSPLTWE